MSCQILAEALYGCGILALGGENHLALVEVHKQADIIMPMAFGGAIHPHQHSARIAHLLPGGAHIVMHMPPEADIIFFEELSYACDRHLLGHQDHIRLEKKREPTSRLPPRQRYQPRSAAGTVASRHSGRNEGLALKTVQRPAPLLLGVVGFTARLTADRTAKTAFFGKINQDVSAGSLKRQT
jgi:hypothetical protein